MSAPIVSTPFAATTHTAPKPGAIVWRWLVLLLGSWSQQRKIARDGRWLLGAPDCVLDDIGIKRSQIETACRNGHHAPRG